MAAKDEVKAISRFQKAYQLGDRSRQMFASLIRLLSKAGRIIEAHQYGQRYASHWPSLQAAPLSVAQQMQEQANESSIAAARENVKQNPGEPVAYIRLGQLLIFAGNAAEAKEMPGAKRNCSGYPWRRGPTATGAPAKSTISFSDRHLQRNPGQLVT